MSHDQGRRGFLRQSIAIVPATLVTGAGCTKSEPTEATTSSTAVVQSAQAYSPAFFNAAEWSFIKAAVARLIPADEVGPGALESGVPEFIDRQMDAVFGHASQWYMQGPFVESSPEFGYQSKLPPRDVYRAGIEATQAHCKQTLGGKTFEQLESAQQDDVLTALEKGNVNFENLSAKTFFAFLLQNTKEGYLSDPIHGGNKGAMSWKMIGFPGARADFADWIGRPGVPYPPLPPVSINGPQG